MFFDGFTSAAGTVLLSKVSPVRNYARILRDHNFTMPSLLLSKKSPAGCMQNVMTTTLDPGAQDQFTCYGNSLLSNDAHDCYVVAVLRLN
jgi:hypothetical protein